jgi:cell division protein FtsL
MTKRKVRRMKISKGEKILYLGAVLAFSLTLILKVFCGARIGHLNMSVEKLKFEITNQEKKVESLTMKINELTSFDKVKDIVKDMGLAYNNDNIIVINK